VFSARVDLQFNYNCPLMRGISAIDR
jgi:hypothetical protein